MLRHCSRTAHPDRFTDTTATSHHRPPACSFRHARGADFPFSEDGGDTWQIISPPTATAEFNSNLGGIAVDPAGTLWIAGTLDAWAVARRTSDGVWMDIEFPFGIEAGRVASGATAITIDSSGNVYAGGRVRERHDEIITSRLVLQELPLSPQPQLEVVASENTLLISWPS